MATFGIFGELKELAMIKKIWQSGYILLAWTLLGPLLAIFAPIGSYYPLSGLLYILMYLSLLGLDKFFPGIVGWIEDPWNPRHDKAGILICGGAFISSCLILGLFLIQLIIFLLQF